MIVNRVGNASHNPTLFSTERNIAGALLVIGVLAILFGGLGMGKFDVFAEMHTYCAWGLLMGGAVITVFSINLICGYKINPPSALQTIANKPTLSPNKALHTPAPLNSHEKSIPCIFTTSTGKTVIVKDLRAASTRLQLKRMMRNGEYPPDAIRTAVFEEESALAEYAQPADSITFSIVSIGV